MIYIGFHRVIDDGLDWKGVCSGRLVFPRPSRFSADASSCIRTDLAKPAGGTFRRQHAPRCDVTASQLDAMRSRANQPGFLFVPTRQAPRICTDQRICGCIQLEAASVSRKKFGSSSAGTMPSGKTPWLYSAMRFFHFKNSVRFWGSIRISTRRRLASSRFIS
jgi:hypothetical protein